MIAPLLYVLGTFLTACVALACVRALEEIA